MQLPGVPWTSSGALDASSGPRQHLGPNDYGNERQGSQNAPSPSMGPGLYGDYDEGMLHPPNEQSFYDGATDMEMSLEMITEVDDSDFDEDVSATLCASEDLGYDHCCV